MIVGLNRLFGTSEETVGVLMIDRRPFCFSLEDEFRLKKVVKETRIPAGEYELILKSFGGFHTRYRQRFGLWHAAGMIQITPVGGNNHTPILVGEHSFTDILIHCGNKDEDTDGCILTGDVADLNNGKDGMTVGRSTDAYTRFYQKVAPEIARSGRVKFFVTDGDRT